MNILGVSRSPRFSPNSTDRDEAIFEAVGKLLEAKGHCVSRCCEDDGVAVIEKKLSQAGLVYTMARDRAVLKQLAAQESEGVTIVNSPKSLMSQTRGSMFRMFYSRGLPVARTFCVRPDSREDELPPLEFPLWVKRSDECAQVKDDVLLVNNMEELRDTCRDYFERGIEEALLCEHIEGELLKFYGVSGTDFFYAFSTDTRHGFSKFGLEHTNKVTSHYAFDKGLLKKYADQAAVLSGISVYGGDAVVSEKGVYIIDFNDWPSFSPCRDAAAEAIVNCLFYER